VLALHAVGLLPQLGIRHADKDGRDSLALDLLESVRPLCDRIALQIFDTGLGIPYDQRTGKPQYFDRRWVHEVKQTTEDERAGQCKLDAPFTHRLASHAADIGSAVRPHAYKVARMLADAADGQVTATRPKGVKLTDRARLDHRQYPKNRLRNGVTPADIIPDDLWSQIEPLIPPRNPRTRGVKPPHPRIVCTALVARFVLGVPWSMVPGSFSYMTVTRWRDQWDTSGAWPKVRKIVEDHGHLQSLIE
jgi:transposase